MRFHIPIKVHTHLAKVWLAQVCLACRALRRTWTVRTTSGFWPKLWLVTSHCYGPNHMAKGQNHRTPSEQPNPTTKIPTMFLCGEFTYQPIWDPKTVLTITAIFFKGTATGHVREPKAEEQGAFGAQRLGGPFSDPPPTV